MLSVNELWAFFAIVLFLGTMKVRDRRNLWSITSKYYNQWVASTMECGRFEDILFCLHWMNTAALTSEEKRDQHRQDPFFPVSGFLEHLRARFQLYFTPGQDIDVDEQGIPSKCYHSAIQYNKDKPHKWFFKVWSLNCSKTAYCFNYGMYKGGDTERDGDMPASSYPVEKLSRNEILWHKGHIMHADNYFNGPELVYIMRDRGIHLNGTIRTNRFERKWGIPKEWFFKKKTDAPRGTMKAKRVVYTRHGNRIQAWIISWIDNKAVNVVTTFKPAWHFTVRNAKDPQNRHVRLQTPPPRPTRLPMRCKTILLGYSIFAQNDSFELSHSNVFPDHA
jgi:hypothetical protein